MFILLLSRTYLGNGFSSTIHKSCKLTSEENGMLLAWGMGSGLYTEILPRGGGKIGVRKKKEGGRPDLVSCEGVLAYSNTHTRTLVHLHSIWSNSKSKKL